MGDRYYTQQLAYHRRHGGLKLTSTTAINKNAHISFIECVLGLEGELDSLNRVSLYGLEKLRNCIERKILDG